MKEYRLAAWPHLRAPFDRIAYRRMLSDMSQRHMSIVQLAGASGMRRHDVKSFVEGLVGQGMVTERESLVRESLFGSLRPLGGWLRRLASMHVER